MPGMPGTFSFQAHCSPPASRTTSPRLGHALLPHVDEAAAEAKEKTADASRELGRRRPTSSSGRDMLSHTPLPTTHEHGSASAVAGPSILATSPTSPATPSAALRRATRRLVDLLPSDAKATEAGAKAGTEANPSSVPLPVALGDSTMATSHLPSALDGAGYLGDARLDGLGITHSPPHDGFTAGDEGVAVGTTSLDLSHYPLPIRLGLLNPAHLSSSARKQLCRTDRPYAPCPPCIEVLRKMQPTQYCKGYYLYTAPPTTREAAVREETKVTSPPLSTNGTGVPTPSTARDFRRLASSGRGRSSSDIAPSNSARRPSVKSQSSSGSQPQKWKLEQYFHSYKRRVASRTHEYRFHAYPAKDACYWWGYNVKTLVSETLTHNIITSIANLSVAGWEDGSQPSRVLDIGTGVGNWVLDAARRWKEAEFVGLDLVPVQTPLKHLDDDMRSRISWVVANALQGLPFPDNSFDFVHIRMINTGVPEDKWAFILAEAIRVLSPNGRLEVFEGDWSFFGMPKQIPTKDLQDLLSGQSRLSHEALRMRKRKNGKRYDRLGVAVDAMMQTRLIKSDPSSIIPFHLMSLEVGDIGQGRTRHFPILARSSTFRINQEASDKASSAKRMWTPASINDQSFTLRPQIGQPLPPHQFHVESMDILRMAILVADVTRISEARDLIWEESLLGDRAKGALDKSPRCGWDHFGHYEREMDEWYKDMMDRADLENLLKSTFDWNEAASRMDSRIHLDRETRRRMKSQAALPGTPPTTSFFGQASGADKKDSDGESSEEDQETLRQDTPTPSSVSPTTDVLTFRTTTVFTARKRGE